MDESNHEMVNMLTQQIGTIFNPLFQTTNNSYQLLANQMGRMTDFFGAPNAPNTAMHNGQNEPIPNVVVDNNQRQDPLTNIIMNANPRQEPIPVAQQPPIQNALDQNQVVLVNRNQNADEVVRNVQQNNFVGQNNLAHLVENILAQNGLNIGLHRPNFVSALSEFVLQTELPRNWKTPKLTKFSGDTNESTVEHIARYLVECGELANNENLRMKFFPNSLTKNAFTWFTTLPPPFDS